jgi:hypothetical protein
MWVAGATLKPQAEEIEQTIFSQLFNNLGFKEISTFAFYHLSFVINCLRDIETGIRESQHNRVM